MNQYDYKLKIQLHIQGMNMGRKSTFQNYVIKHGFFWLKENPSKKLDHLLANEHIRQSIQTDELSHRSWQKANHVVSGSYAKLINTALRSAVLNLKIEDFLNPEGMMMIEKSSPAQHAYLQTHKALSEFIKKDILQHKKPISAQSALCRWIRIAAHLREQQSYDGLCLVMATLNSADLCNLSLIDNLPKTEQHLFDELTSLISPYKNFANYRKEIGALNDPNCLPIMSVMVRDLTYFDNQLYTAILTPSGKLLPSNPIMPVLLKKLALFKHFDSLSSIQPVVLTSAEQKLFEACLHAEAKGQHFEKCSKTLKANIRRDTWHEKQSEINSKALAFFKPKKLQRDPELNYKPVDVVARGNNTFNQTH